MKIWQNCIFLVLYNHIPPPEAIKSIGDLISSYFLFLAYFFNLSVMPDMLKISCFFEFFSLSNELKGRFLVYTHASMMYLLFVNFKSSRSFGKIFFFWENKIFVPFSLSGITNQIYSTKNAIKLNEKSRRREGEDVLVWFLVCRR